MDVLKIGDTGPFVALVQSVLRKAGLYGGRVDGVFSDRLKAAVIAFQTRRKLSADGIVGEHTWVCLRPLIDGYFFYTIKPGDTLFGLSQRFSSGVNRILAANPGLEAPRPAVGREIIIPHGTIIPRDVSYSSALLTRHLNAFSAMYPFLETGLVGQSALGQDIPYLRLGTGKKEVFFSAGIHANEWIMTPVLMAFAERFLMAYIHNGRIGVYNARDMFNAVSIYIAPMLNPDGVDLVTGALAPGSAAYNRAKKIASNYPDIPFPDGWKANINGIDLNSNFPAQWEKAKEIKYGLGYTTPAPRDFVGQSPLSAEESAALYRFTRAHHFHLTLAFHTQGRVIFWQYENFEPYQSCEIGQRFSEASGYALEQPSPAASYAGYKDWFIEAFLKPGYTVEAGLGENPLPIGQFDRIFAECEKIMMLAAALAPEAFPM